MDDSNNRSTLSGLGIVMLVLGVLVVGRRSKQNPPSNNGTNGPVSAPPAPAPSSPK